MRSELQNKLLHYEVQPPEGVWGRIAATLDENISPAVTQKLYRYEEQPSHSAWQRVASQLDASPQKGKLVPFYIRYRRPLKYSGAVAVLLFLAVVTSLLISKQTESELPQQTVTTGGNTKDPDTVKAPVESDQHSIAQKLERSRSEPIAARSKTPVARTNRTSASFSFAESFLPVQAERNEIVGSSVAADKYMIYSDGDGNAVRLPKKIFNAFACPADNFDCKQRLQKLREKFAASATTADFNGLLEILKSLQENQ